jgi:acyl carrier protein
MVADELVLQRCRDAVADPDLDWTQDLYEAGLDSIGLLELSAALSEDAGTEVLVSDVFNCTTPAEVAALLRQQDPAASRP